MNRYESDTDHKPGATERLIRFCLDNKAVVLLLMLLVGGWGLLVAPFDWSIGGILRDPVPVDAIPDIGENQQIVFTDLARVARPRTWRIRSPIPLPSHSWAFAGVDTIRSYSMFGVSADLLDLRGRGGFLLVPSRASSKNSTACPTARCPRRPAQPRDPTPPAGSGVLVHPGGPRLSRASPTGGWDLHELRTVQDWYVRYALHVGAGRQRGGLGGRLCSGIPDRRGP